MSPCVAVAADSKERLPPAWTRRRRYSTSAEDGAVFSDDSLANLKHAEMHCVSAAADSEERLPRLDASAQVHEFG